ncbi:LLM class flavin-dependent oxidoreductase [Pseudonocardia spinosispora]|uniref:LLM class flavin-dependent oxidoreductase n=1 Tax=Pseudonocardia spinosispora TaxID=103441 RepID=UPI000407F08F|nr:LLM class flavin-dependent oxidoreductase [Pseudonocardia spinosispora]
MTTTRLGYLLPTRDRAVHGDSELAPLIDLATRAERLGFDSVWAGDSPITRPRADPLLVLAAAAAVTHRVQLGTAVLLAALRHPILLAHQLATLDRLSDGRLIAGMGAGFPHRNTAAQFAALGVDFDRRTTRLTESIEVMRRLWTEREVAYQGRHFDFRDVTVAPRPARPGGPPVWLAGSGPALRRVARVADGWLPYPPSPATYAEELATVRRLTPALYATVCVDSDPERGRARLRASIERYYNASLERVETVQATFAGSAAATAGWLRSYTEAGARHIVVRFAVDDHAEALDQFADQVLPALRVGSTPGHPDPGVPTTPTQSAENPDSREEVRTR